jgi:hypothetical protein
MIGSGQFLLESSQRDVAGRARRRHDSFEKGRPYLDGIHRSVAADTSQALARCDRNGRQFTNDFQNNGEGYRYGNFPTDMIIVAAIAPPRTWDPFIANDFSSLSPSTAYIDIQQYVAESISTGAYPSLMRRRRLVLAIAAAGVTFAM